MPEQPIQEKKLYIIFFKILLIIASAIIAVLLVFLIGIYKFNWDGPVTEAISKFIPLPAAVVSGRIVTLDRLNKIINTYEYAVAGTSAVDFLSVDGKNELRLQKQRVLARLIDNEIVSRELEKREVVVDQAMLDEYFQHLLARFKISQDQADFDLSATFGWDEADFKKYVVEPVYRRELLSYTLIKEQGGDSVYDKIVSAKYLLGEGANFSEVAMDFSDDQSSYFLGGDLGFVAYSEISPWLAKEAFSLANGQTSDILISPRGYHILHLSGREAEPGNMPRIHLMQILAEGDDLEIFLNEVRPNYNIQVFSKGLK